MTEKNHDVAEAQAELERHAEVHSHHVYEGRRVSLRIDEITDRPGHTFTREIVEHPGAVVMIPITADGRIILVKQWRRSASKVLIELPAGTVEKGEPPAETAARELQEEIGYRAGRLTEMGGFFSAPGVLTEYLHLYLAEDLQESHLDPDDNEKIEVLTVTITDAIQMIEEGVIEDAKSIAGISRYYIRQARP